MNLQNYLGYIFLVCLFNVNTIQTFNTYKLAYKRFIKIELRCAKNFYSIMFVFYNYKVYKILFKSKHVLWIFNQNHDYFIRL